MAHFEERYFGTHRRMGAWLQTKGYEALISNAEVLLRTCNMNATTASRDRVLSLIMAPESQVPLLSLGTLLRNLLSRRRAEENTIAGLDILYRHVIEATGTFVKKPPRDPGDWSIEYALGCSCALCSELETFLRDPRSVEYDWPIAKEKRRHIHNVIDSLGLPVSHTTRRKGRPYTLQLRKHDALFSCEKTWHDRHKKLLAWLRKSCRAFE